MIDLTRIRASAIAKSFGKKTGIYENNAENRKLGRVGQKYTKENVEGKKEVSNIQMIRAFQVKDKFKDSDEILKLRAGNSPKIFKDNDGIFWSVKKMVGSNGYVLNQAKEEPKSKEELKKEKEDSSNDKGKIYHTSNRKINNLSNDPLWFATEKKHATEGWSKHIEEEHGQSYIYEAKIKGSIATADNKMVKELFKKANISFKDYINTLVANPEPDEVMNEKGTKLLMDNNYSGVVHSDYDPRDFNKDLDSIVIFNPKESLKDFNLIK